jgi:hypothetical protein
MKTQGKRKAILKPKRSAISGTPKEGKIKCS